MIRLLLADDHSLFREALRGLLESQIRDLSIVGEAATGRETLTLWETLQPDVVVLDISMPDLGGLEILSRIATSKTRVVVVSQHSERGYVIRALKAGAKGFVPKSAAGRELVAAIRAVLGGKTYVEPSIAGHVVDAALHPQDAQDFEELGQLTTREQEVLRLVAEGRTSKEVAQLLNISPHTVNRHRANLMDKLGLHSKTDLVKLAIKLELIDV